MSGEIEISPFVQEDQPDPLALCDRCPAPPKNNKTDEHICTVTIIKI